MVVVEPMTSVSMKDVEIARGVVDNSPPPPQEKPIKSNAQHTKLFSNVFFIRFCSSVYFVGF
jgi:hypothetical protein